MKKINNVLAVLIIVLSAIVIAMGVYIVTNKNSGKEENASNVEENKTKNLASIGEGDKINNAAGVSTEVLERLLTIIGVTPSEWECEDCLNYYLSKDNYGTDERNVSYIISYYKDAYEHNLLSNPPQDVYISDKCNMAADCYTIPKKDAERIFKQYNFSGNILDYFKESDKLDNDYIYFYAHTMGLCFYDTIHDLNVEYTSSVDIKITDNQTITEYDGPKQDEYSKVKNNLSKVVIYNFKNDNNDYYLSSVEVK